MAKSSKSFLAKVWRVLSGYEIAVVTMFLLLILTWLCTLDMADRGIYTTVHAYYDIENFFVQPHFKFNPLPFYLPGGFWVCALLTVNLICGGIVRVIQYRRKGLHKYIGVLLAHFSMAALMVSGAITSIEAKHAHMTVVKGETSDYAQRYTEHSIEIVTYDDAGKHKEPLVIPSERMQWIKKNWENTRLFQFPDLPFDLEVGGFRRNAVIVPTKSEAPVAAEGQFEVDGVFLKAVFDESQEEANSGGCYVKVIEKESKKETYLILSTAVLHPVTVTVDDTIYGLRMLREIWPMPYVVQLDETEGEYYPGSSKPKSFMSKITRFKGEESRSFHIEMNEPMRSDGYTLYQAKWANPEGAEPQSTFEIVTDPASRGPEYCLWVAMVGLCIHFGTSLAVFVMRSTKSKSTNQKTTKQSMIQQGGAE